ncbi:hypothetical protein SAY86_002877 [Trapa natans]|uniref:acid phosphatase n=1 Tax=Trapa natans TaxID=22666 RepID=A0AAN7LRS4_TRANT|nr:hypothetical protein SAY86_002877 [Trapa natans]
MPLSRPSSTAERISYSVPQIDCPKKMIGLGFKGITVVTKPCASVSIGPSMGVAFVAVNMGGTSFSSIPSRSSSSLSSFAVLVVVVLALTFNGATVCNGGKTSTFVRKLEKINDMPLDSDVFRVPAGYNAPQQVHITQGDLVGKAVIVSWVTVDEPGSSVVRYWSDHTTRKKEAKGKYKTYKLYSYTSGYIHHCSVRNLEYNTKYYYKVGIDHTGETKPFKSYTNRFRVPYRASGSSAPFWYSVKRASAYIIVLASYSACGILLSSSGPYCTLAISIAKCYNYHYMEGETMRVMFEGWFVEHKVDVVFAGHVHSYERSERVSNIAYNVVNGKCTPVKDKSAPVYITIGDGGTQ